MRNCTGAGNVADETEFALARSPAVLPSTQFLHWPKNGNGVGVNGLAADKVLLNARRHLRGWRAGDFQPVFEP